MQLQVKAEGPLLKKLNLKLNKKDIKKYILDSFKNGKIFGYFLNEKLIACGGVVIDKEKIAYIRHVFVLPEFQGKGIGTKIMKHLEKNAEKSKKLRLYVLVENHAVDFYEKLGYKKYAYIMEK